MDSEVICDKGCNMKMARREYEGNNCFIHLANLVSRQGEEITKLNDVVGRQVKEITELNDGLNRARCQLKSSENVVIRQQQELQSLTLYNKPPNSHWGILDMKISLGQSHVLECDDKNNSAAAKLVHPLEPSNSSFKIQILNTSGKIGIGLTRKGLPTYNAPLFIEGSVGCFSNGSVSLDGKWQKTLKEWRNGDIIECGIKFPNNFMNDGTKSVDVYFSVNEGKVFKKDMEMPQGGFFPSIYISKGEKVKYWCN